MNRRIETQIREAEERLRIAMLRSDVDALDELLAPELLFTNHLGQLLSKKDDLEAHKSGLLKVNELSPSEQQMRLYGNVAVVSVRMCLAGTYGGSPANGDFRFTRVWSAAPDGISWHIVAAHATLVA
jgi:ketosteroid isomerase-like protein